MSWTRPGLIIVGWVAGWAVFPAAGAPVPAQAEGTTPVILWSAASDPPSNEMHDPLVVNDLVVVGTDRGDLRAFRAGTGKEAWSYHLGKRIYHRPSTDGDRVYFTGGNAVTAVTADAGKKLWAFGLTRDDAPTCAARETGLVFTADHDGTLYALDARTGARKWSADFAADAPKDPPGFSGESARFEGTKARPSKLASDGEAVYLSVFDQCRVIAFSATTGKRLWAFQTGGWVYGQPLATANRVFIGSQDKCFYCLDKKTGKPVWKYATKGRIESGGAADDTAVYFGSCDGTVYCLNQADGTARWTFDADRKADGKMTSIYSVPVLRRGTVCIAAGEGQLYSLAAATGKLRWKIRAEPGSDLYCSAATAGRSYFVTARPRLVKDGQYEGSSVLVAISSR